MSQAFVRPQRDLRLTTIPVMPHEALLLADLTLIHRDSFDRMLVCQAKARGLTFVTSDKAIQQYGVSALW